MTDQEYLQEITEIKKIMNRSSRFISLSGMSGVLAGIYALIGATAAIVLISNYQIWTVAFHYCQFPIWNIC